MRFECENCGRRFNAHAAFADHRVGEFTTEPPDFGRRCLNDFEMRSLGYALQDGVWHRPGSLRDHTGAHHTARHWQAPSSPSHEATGGTP